jgi:hypothetical protein
MFEGFDETRIETAPGVWLRVRVTEHGVARLRGRTLAERRKALAAITGWAPARCSDHGRC